jgi:hypothetical protein
MNAQPRPSQSGVPIGHTFAPLLDPALEALALGELEPLDVIILGMVYRRRDGQSSPGHRCTKEAIAAELGNRWGSRTIQRSLARLKPHRVTEEVDGQVVIRELGGWMDHVGVPNPDPADGRNQTGYRVVFPRLTPGNAYQPALRTYPASPPCLPPGRQSRVSPGGDKSVSPTNGGETGREKATTTLGGEFEPGDAIACIQRSSSSLSIAPEPEPEKPRTDTAGPSGDVPVLSLPAAAAPDGPPELVAAAAAVIPEANRQWVRHLVGECGRYGVALALLILAWVKARLEHRDPEKRPSNPRQYALAAARSWYRQLADGIATFASIQAEIRASPRCQGAALFDPGTFLARLRAEGWNLVRDGPGSVKPVKVRDSAPDWDCISLRGIRELAKVHRDELKAYVLGGEGVPDDP